jgi:hypothetical protein
MMTISIAKPESEIKNKMKRLRKQSRFIELWKVTSILPDYPFSNIGLILLAGKMDHEK